MLFVLSLLVLILLIAFMINIVIFGYSDKLIGLFSKYIRPLDAYAHQPTSGVWRVPCGAQERAGVVYIIQ